MRHGLFHAPPLIFVILLASACGGGGGGGSLASAPSPVAVAPAPAPSFGQGPALVSTQVTRTPLTGYTALTLGSYPTIAIGFHRAEGSRSDNTFGLETIQLLDSSAVRMAVEPNRTYSLEFAVANLPPRQTFDLGHERVGSVQGLTYLEDFGQHVVNSFRFSDGSTKTIETDGLFGSGSIAIRETSPGVAEGSTFQLYLGDNDVVGQQLRYVSLGSWARNFYETANGGFSNFRYSPGDAVYFASGQRTAAADLPVSGTATYSARVLGTQSSRVDVGAAIRIDVLRLTADFSARSIEAAIDVPFAPEDDCCRGTLGINLSGRGAIQTSGDFLVPLSGVSNLGTPSSNPLAGTLQGGFFGPGAQEAGGVIQLVQGGVPIFAGSFAGSTTGR